MNTKATLAVLAYYAFNLILYAVLPGKQVEGTKLRTGKKLKYKFNGNNNDTLPFKASLRID